MTPIVSSNAKGASHPNHPSAHLETIRRSSLETFQSRLTPRRLTVLIEAPAAAIERVLEQHAEVRQLVEHGSLHLLRIASEDGRCHRYRRIGHWQPLPTP